MAGSDPPRSLLSLIRDFASEKSQGERRLVGLKKQIEELRLQLEAANSELEEAKRLKETTEQELKGFEVELALNKASIQTLEARIALIQDEIFTVGSELEELKHKEATLRDEFITEMVEFNSKIRKFQETIATGFQNENTAGNVAEHAHKFAKKEVSKIAATSSDNQLSHVISQIAKEEEEYLAEQNIQKQVQLELLDIERKVSLMEAMVQQTQELDELTRQTSELENIIASLSEELEKKCTCPSCHVVNVETLSGILQEMEAK